MNIKTNINVIRNISTYIYLISGLGLGLRLGLGLGFIKNYIYKEIFSPKLYYMQKKIQEYRCNNHHDNKTNNFIIYV